VTGDRVDPARDGLLSLSPHQARTVAAVFERMFPAGEDGPGAVEIGAVAFLDRALAGHDRHLRESYQLGLAALDRAARERCGAGFADCTPQEQDGLVADLEAARLPGFHVPEQGEFFGVLRAHLQEGLFADPAHGGNRDLAGWRFLRHPGVWLEHSAEEQRADEPVGKGGEVRSLAHAGFRLGGHDDPAPDVPGYDPQRAAVEPPGPADVIIVGMGAVGGFVSALLADAGLKVVGFEAGGWRHRSDYHPDELGAAYYCRGDMGPKFLAEAPRWRRDAGEPTRPITFSLGRMMNGVGGSVVHWGGALRRMHPHQFAYRSHVLDRWGASALPEHATLTDWPLTYDELEPYYDLCERVAGVAGDRHANPFVPRRTDYPMPPLRPTRKGALFTAAARGLGLHPHPTPVCVNSVPYNGLPATRYHPWSAGFGAFHDDRWNPGLTSVPQALASGNLDLRTHCRVLRVLTDRQGHADGVEYVDPLGVVRTHRARTVVLASYTFETVRLMMLSADDRHPDGLGGSTGQLGRHFMVKQWGDVYGTSRRRCSTPTPGRPRRWSPSTTTTRGLRQRRARVPRRRQPQRREPAAAPADRPRPAPAGRGVVGPLLPGAPAGVAARGGRAHPARLAVVHDRLPRPGSPLPRPQRLRPAGPARHHRHAAQRAPPAGLHAGPVRGDPHRHGRHPTWNGPRYRGVASSHDLGGARMGEDARTSVVDRDLRVHDTPGLLVFSGAAFPTCTGVNPHLTIMAITARATQRLVERLRGAPERIGAARGSG
jgi:gluconate 2-dehydrogenase alpha chain